MAYQQTYLFRSAFGASLFLLGCADSSASGSCLELDQCEESRASTQDSTQTEDVPQINGGKKDAGSGSKATGAPARTDAGANTSSTSGSTSSSEGGLPCDVQAIISTKCGTCHGQEPAYGAPMALAKASDFQKASGESKLYELVEERIKADAKKKMPPASSAQLSASELTTLSAWLDTGAKASSERCTDAASDDEPPDNLPDPEKDDKLECYKLTAHAGDLKTKYKVGAAVDAYYTFTFAAPWQGTGYATLARPIIDNKEVIHHWLLFQDDLPGIPGGAVPTIGAHPGGQLLYGWAPGGESLDFRNLEDAVALELPSTTTYTIEYHYNSKDPNAQDASGVEICVSKEKPANIAGLSWLGFDNLLIPSTTWSGTCIPTAQEPIHIVSVTPHMHLKGTHMKGVINRKDGTKEVLHDEPFDFDYQRLYKKDVVINPGDTITTECTFSEPTTFGESTNAEMCYLFTMAYPKGALTGLDLWGSFAHGGSSCLGM